MNHNIRARIAQQAANGVGLHQVVVGAAGHEHVLGSVLAQFIDDEGPRKPAPCWRMTQTRRLCQKPDG